MPTVPASPPCLRDRALHGGIYRLMDGDGLLRREEGGPRGAGGGGWTAGSLTDMPGESDRDRRFLPGGAEFVKCVVKFVARDESV